MKKILIQLLSIAVLVGFFQACDQTFVEDEPTDEIQLKSASAAKAGYIVVLNDADLNMELSGLKGYEKKQLAVKAKTEKILKRAGITDGEIGHVYGTALQGFSVKIAPGQLKKLEADPSIKYIQPDRIISLRLPRVTIKKKPTPTPPQQTEPWGIARVNGGVDGTGKTAWIVDTGVDIDHPDLVVDTDRSRTFVLTEPIPTFDDLHGHGTHVAGTIAAKNNDIGVVGVAAGATVISCRVLDRSGSGSFSWSVAALDYIASVGSAGDVVNMSLGPSSRYTDTAVDAAVQAVAAKGIKLSIAAGNESDDCSYYSPAHNDGNNIYTISASDINNNWAYFSNYGAPVDYCEPGYSIYSTYKDGGYATMSGTSMAAPHMAGILLLGNPISDGFVNNDPDGDDDPIGIADDSGVDPGPEPDPTNTPPVAEFSATIDGLTVTFANTSSDADGDVLNMSWNFGDGNSSTATSPLHTYSAAGTYSVSLTVDDGKDTDVATQSITVVSTSSGDIELTASLRKVRGVRYVDLTWSGASGDSVLIKVNGADLDTTDNDGAATLDMARASGTFTFQICETGDSACSNIETLIL